MQTYEAWQALGSWICQHEPRFGPGVKDRFEHGSKIPEQEVRQGVLWIQQSSLRVAFRCQAVTQLPASCRRPPHLGVLSNVRHRLPPPASQHVTQQLLQPG